jgi:sulfonate transport system permease protein
MTRERIRDWLGFAAVMLLWEVAGRTTSFGHSVTSSPSSIAAQYWRDADLYALHLVATVQCAATGFCFGTAVAIGAAILFCRYPVIEATLGGVNIALFAMPPIVVGPILVLMFNGNLPQTILAGLIVYFPTMAATLVGLRDVDPRLSDVIHTYGGGPNQLLRFIRLRSAVPSILAGLRTAAALSVLGAILGEFGSGVRWGLGSFLLGSLGASDPARLWGIALATTAISMVGYSMFALMGRKIGKSTVAVTISACVLPSPFIESKRLRNSQRALLLLAAIVTPFAVWWIIIRGTGISTIIAPSPVDILKYLFVKPGSDEARATLLAALAQTLPLAAAGLICGLAAAFFLAALSVVRPALARAITPVAVLLQTTPLVVLTPIILLMFGRDNIASIVMAVLVVFLPAYVILAEGFALVPKAATELVQAYGGGKVKQLVFIHVPYAAPYVFAAAKLVAPRALLGVMVAEWLLSGVGLGNLLNSSRGMLDYDMVWAGAVVSVIIAIAAYQAVAAVERLLHY